MSFEVTCDFKTTLPSGKYPPASPYARLTDYLRELIQEKILTRFIVKALLYPEFLRDIDTTEVRLRRRHKTVVRMYRHGTTSSEGSGNSNMSSEREFERQDAIENYTTSDDESRIYSGVHYKTDKRDSWDRTIYESFIDHGEGAGEIRYQKLHDSFGSLCFVTDCGSPTEDRESFMIGSKPSRYTPILGENDNFENVTHLSTARMHLLGIKQKSEQSQNSSFDNEHKLSGEKWKNMAFEDLLSIDEIKPLPSAKSPMQDRHHSMPNQFVGNRFNVSSLTEIYIPSCKNYGAEKIGTPCNSIEEHDESHSHSREVSSHKDKSVEVDCDNAKKTSDEHIGGSCSKDNENDEIFKTRCDSKFLPPATIYSSDSDSGMAGSYTLSPSDQPFPFHRSFLSRTSNPPNLVTSSTDYYVHHTISDPSEHRRRALENSFIHDDSTEGENKTKIVINIGGGDEKERKSHENVYFSGMYVHWWRKETLPVEMFEAIVKPSDDDCVEKKKRGNEKGSGKKKNPLKSSLMMLHLSVFFLKHIPFLFCTFFWIIKLCKNGNRNKN